MKLVLFALTLSSLAFGAAEEITTNTLRSESDLGLSSSQNRQNKNVTTTAQLLGIGPSGVVSTGVNVGFFLSPDSLLQLEISGGKTKDNSSWLFGDWADKTVREGFSAGMHFKHFPGNSFYLKAGLDYRTFSYKQISETWSYSSSSWSTSSYTRREFKGESVAAGLSLGNQWQFDSFTLGCDWFGLELPLVSRIYDEKFSSNADQYDRKNNKEDQRFYVTGLGYTALRLYLGASF